MSKLCTADSNEFRAFAHVTRFKYENWYNPICSNYELPITTPVLPSGDWRNDVRRRRVSELTAIPDRLGTAACDWSTRLSRDQCLYWCAISWFKWTDRRKDRQSRSVATVCISLYWYCLISRLQGPSLFTVSKFTLILLISIAIVDKINTDLLK